MKIRQTCYSLLILICVLTLNGCGVFNENPNDVVKKGFDAVKDFNEEAIHALLIQDSYQLNGIGGDAEIVKQFYQNMDYNIISSSVKGDTALVITEITNTDTSLVINDSLSVDRNTMFSELLSVDNLKQTDEETSELVKTKLAASFKKYVEDRVHDQVAVYLLKMDGHWKIVLTDRLKTALSGGDFTLEELYDRQRITPEETIRAINIFVNNDIVDNGFNEIESYSLGGTGSDGQPIDINLVLNNLDAAYQKKKECDNYIKSLNKTEYSDIAQKWNDLSSEIDVLYTKVKNRGIDPSAGTFALYGSKYLEYLCDFSSCVSSSSMWGYNSNSGEIENSQNVESAATDSNSDAATVLSVSASSELPEGKSSNYFARNLIDGNEGTCWAENQTGDGLEGQGKDEWLSFQVDGRVKGIKIMNGYSKNNTTYYSNNRIKTMRVEFADGSNMEFEIEDAFNQFQNVEFGRIVDSNEIKLIITDIYKGDKYNDLCVSEIEFY